MGVVVAITWCCIGEGKFGTACGMTKDGFNDHAFAAVESANNFVPGHKGKTHPMFKIGRCVTFHSGKVASANAGEQWVYTLPFAVH